jgi:hypothetical protein
MKKIYLIMLIIESVVFVSYHPSRLMYKPIVKPLIIDDSISLKISNGALKFLGGFYYSMSFPDFIINFCDTI